MYRITILSLFIITLLTTGCGDTFKSKEELLTKGGQFMGVHNPNGAIILFKKALEKDPNFFEARLQLAKAYIEVGKLDSAENELQKAVRQNPSSKDVHIELGKVYVLNSKPDEALKEIADYLGGSSNDADVAEIASLAYAIKGDYSQSISLLKNVLLRNKNRLTAEITLAKVYLMADRPVDAKVQISEILKNDPGNRNALSMLAEIQIKQDDIDGAIKTYEQMLKSDPSNVETMSRYVMLYIGKGKFDDALSLSEKIIREFPKRPEGYLTNGIVLYSKKNYPEAIAALQKSVALGPNVSAYYYLGLSHYYKGNLEQAITDLQSALNLNASFDAARILSSAILLKANRVDDAISEIKKVLERNDQNALAHNILGSAYIAKGIYDKAIVELNRSIELDPKQVGTHIKKGLYQIGAGRAKEAEAELKAAVEIEPGVIQSRALLVSYYMQRSEFDKARSIIQQGMKGQKTDSFLYVLQAEVSLRQNKVVDAVKYLQKAKEMNPEYEFAYLKLASVYILNKEDDKAIQELKSLIEKSPKNVKAFLGIAKLLESKGDESGAFKYYLQAKETGAAEGYHELARHYVRKNKPSDALHVLDEAIKKYPSDIVSFEIKGATLVVQKNYIDGLKTFEEIEKIKPPLGLPYIINTFIEMKKPEKALDRLEKELKKNPRRLELMAEVSRVYMLMGRNRDAIENAKQIIIRNAESPIGYITLAKMYQENKELEKAIEVLKKQAQSKDLELLMKLASLYMIKKEYPLALEQYQRAEQIKPGYIPVMSEKGYALNEMNKKREAITEYQKILNISRDHVRTLNNLAFLYAEQNTNLAEALQLATRASLLAPQDGLVQDTLGFVLFKDKKIEEALIAFRKASELKPDNPSIAFHLALAYKEQGNKAQAIEQLQKALKLGDFPEAKDAKIMLEKLKSGSRG